MDIEDQINGLRRLAAEVPLCWLICFEDRPLQGIPPGREGPHLLLFSSKIKAESFIVNRRKYFGEEPLSLVQVDAPEKLKAPTFLPSRDVRYSTPPCGIVYDFDYETGKARAIISPKKIDRMSERDILQKLGIKITPVTAPVVTPAPVPSAISVPAMELVPQPIPLQVINPIPAELPATPVPPIGRKLPPKTVFFASVVLAATCLLAICIFAVGIILGHGNIAALHFLSFGGPTPTMTPTATPTPTMTPKATSTPTMTPTATLISWALNITDDFNSNVNAWPDINGGTGTCGTEYFHLQPSKLIWRINATEGCIWWKIPGALTFVSDFDVSVDVLISGPSGSHAGLLFRNSDDSNNYYFGIKENSQEFTVIARLNNNWRTFIDWTTTMQIRPGAINRLRVLGLGSHFIFYINGNEIFTLDDTGISSGSVGLGAGVSKGDTSTFEFHNFEFHGR